MQLEIDLFRVAREQGFLHNEPKNSKVFLTGP